jgi:hypothetical protein
MTLPSSDDLNAKLSKETENSDHTSRIYCRKYSLKLTYQSDRKENRKSHLNNKILYDSKFEIGDLVYLYNPAKKTPVSVTSSIRLGQEHLK